ncbi:MAG: hypothetical protein HY529_01475 [Chloroflexi bacterium]|nr:hypothetical protein [Chloroflexota bacterium]
MSKKVKVLISVLAVVVLLTLGGAATVMAQEKPVTAPSQIVKSIDSSGDNKTAGLLARVAEILGIPEDKLVSAFKQAQQERREEALFKALDKAVEKGKLTEAEAKAIKDWWQQKPAFLTPGLLGRIFGFLNRGGHEKNAVPKGAIRRQMPNAKGLLRHEIRQPAQQSIQQSGLPRLNGGTTY